MSLTSTKVPAPSRGRPATTVVNKPVAEAQRSEPSVAATVSSCVCGGSCPRCQSGASAAPSVHVSKHGDHAEREAETLAEEIVRTPTPTTAMPQPPLQSGASTTHTQAQIPAAIRTTLKSSGTPLEEGVRSFMEPRLGYDFSGVRVHRGTDAARSAQLFGANAYTAGQNIVFNAGRYAPHSNSGMRLLAHELVHVVQAGMDAGSHWGAGVRQGASPAAGMPSVSVRERVSPLQVSRDGPPRPDWQILHDLEEVERQLADPALTPGELAELRLRRDFFLTELGHGASATSSPPAAAEAAHTTIPPVPTRSTARATPDSRTYSGTELEAEIARLRGELALLPHDESSDEHDAIMARLATLEANLTQRQSYGQASAELARAAAAMPISLENRIAMAFGAGFTAGALMEFRPAEAQRFVDEINANPGHFGGGVLVGIVEGALEGLWDNIVGLGQLLLWLSPAYWTYRAGGELIEYLRDPEAYEARMAETSAQIQALTAGLGEFLAAVAHDPNFLVIHGEELGRHLGGSAASWFNDDFMARTPYEKGETIGTLTGRILIEVALLFIGPEEWIARGAAAAGQAVRVSARLERAVVAILERLPSMRRFLELRRAASGGVRAVEEAAGGVRTAERVMEGASDTGRALDAATDVERAAHAAPTAPVLDEAGDAARAAERAVDAERAATAVPESAATAPAARTTESVADAERAASHADDVPVVREPHGSGSVPEWQESYIQSYLDDLEDGGLLSGSREEAAARLRSQLAGRTDDEVTAIFAEWERPLDRLHVRASEVERGASDAARMEDLSTIDRPRGGEQPGVLSGDVGEAAEAAGAGASRLPPTYAGHVSAATRAELRRIFSEFGDDALRVFVERLGLPPSGLRQVEIPVSSGLRRVDRLFRDGGQIVLREIKNYPRGILGRTRRITAELAKDLEIIGRYPYARVDWHITGRIRASFLQELRALETQFPGRFQVILDASITVIP